MKDKPQPWSEADEAPDRKWSKARRRAEKERWTKKGAWKGERDSAAEFRWHLLPPWRDRFDFDHWWIAKPGDASLQAAFWEALRRHPKAKRLIDGDPEAERTVLENCLWLHGRNSWPKLDSGIRERWREILEDLPPQRGLETRPVVSLTAQSVNLTHGIRRHAPPEAVLTLDGSLRKLATKDPEARRILENAEREREAEIARLAVEYHRAGHIVIAIPQETADLDKTMSVVRACYKAERKAIRHGKDYFVDWLTLIERFEKAELGGKPDDQLAHQFRTLLRSFSF